MRSFAIATLMLTLTAGVGLAVAHQERSRWRVVDAVEASRLHGGQGLVADFACAVASQCSLPNPNPPCGGPNGKTDQAACIAGIQYVQPAGANNTGCLAPLNGATCLSVGYAPPAQPPDCLITVNCNWNAQMMSCSAGNVTRTSEGKSPASKCGDSAA